ncbi:MAG: DNA polymerase III subunit delta [Clostridium argentinense]|uniref:DNA polymerase III subunit delta n=1 Tax=Clostridium faecium TaxID=2762223 RepID=A0ABR8YXF6_9CLOT|nr:MULTISPECIES: DNA polymerase III subunit delta [Clostridium]MBD8048807.1 DNA polymerase III subunit delta [Clostridium faecium]MBS5824511.1 DNA polymerase III subunit delta [Clostridium argentinense]MDU1348348.1 DNA polymerase III subunit delta [Clostridium argentinense]
MLNLIEFEEKIKKGKFDNCYIFCGTDENLIKTSVNTIISKNIDDNFKDLNFMRLDGQKIDNDTIVNCCETMPFMSDKKIIEIYRAIFLEDSYKSSSDGKKVDFNELSKYLENLPDYSILIMYYIFQSDREKVSSKVKKLEKKATIVKVDKLKGDNLYYKIKNIFEEKGKKIDKSELSFFCSLVENNMNIIRSEVEKLCCYTEDRKITKDDILALMPPKNENDIFNLVDCLSQKNIKKSMEIVNELIYKGEKIPVILHMIQRQFKLLLALRLGSDSGVKADELSKQYRLHPYIAEKMVKQSKKFSLQSLKRNLKLCVETDKLIKSSTSDNKIQLEIFILNLMI